MEIGKLVGIPAVKLNEPVLCVGRVNDKLVERPVGITRLPVIDLRLVIRVVGNRGCTDVVPVSNFSAEVVVVPFFQSTQPGKPPSRIAAALTVPLRSEAP